MEEEDGLIDDGMCDLDNTMLWIKLRGALLTVNKDKCSGQLLRSTNTFSVYDNSLFASRSQNNSNGGKLIFFSSFSLQLTSCAVCEIRPSVCLFAAIWRTFGASRKILATLFATRTSDILCCRPSE